MSAQKDPNVFKNSELETAHKKNENFKDALGVDFGEKLCGLAWSNAGVVFPIGIFKNEGIEFEILKLSEQKSIETVVLGLPISDDGSENHVCKQIRLLGDRLKKNKLDVQYINERLSTQAAIGGNKTNRKDDLAAGKILEFWLQKKD